MRLLEKNGRIASWDVMCTYAYRGVKEHIEMAKNLDSFKKLRESEALDDIRWFCEEEFRKINKFKVFKMLETDLEKAFVDKENILMHSI